MVDHGSSVSAHLDWGWLPERRRSDKRHSVYDLSSPNCPSLWVCLRWWRRGGEGSAGDGGDDIGSTRRCREMDEAAERLTLNGWRLLVWTIRPLEPVAIANGTLLQRVAGRGADRCGQDPRLEKGAVADAGSGRSTFRGSPTRPHEDLDVSVFATWFEILGHSLSSSEYSRPRRPPDSPRRGMRRLLSRGVVRASHSGGGVDAKSIRGIRMGTRRAWYRMWSIDRCQIATLGQIIANPAPSVCRRKGDFRG